MTATPEVTAAVDAVFNSPGSFTYHEYITFTRAELLALAETAYELGSEGRWQSIQDES